MIPEKYINKNVGVGLKVEAVNGKVNMSLGGVNMLAWLEDLEEKYNKLREGLLTAGGAVIMKRNDLVFSDEGKRVEINIYEGDKRLMNILSETADPEKAKLKIYEVTEFIISSILYAKSGDNQLLIDEDRAKQITKNALEKVVEKIKGAEHEKDKPKPQPGETGTPIE